MATTEHSLAKAPYLCGRNDREQHPASGAYPCYTNHYVYSIKIYISQFKFVPEFWLRKKISIILWKIEFDLVNEPSIWYTVCHQYA